MRIFITPDNRGFFQLNEETYAKWGRAKIKKLDLKSKIARIIDPNTSFNGWKTGISIKL